MTVAPLVRKSCTTTVPTPPAAAETATVSPGETSIARTATKCRAPDDIQRACDLPVQPRRLRDQLGDGNGAIVGVAGASLRPPQDVVADCELFDPGADRMDHSGEIASLTRWEGGGEPRLQCALTAGCFTRVESRRSHREP